MASSGIGELRSVAIAGGIVWAIIFIVAGLGFQFQIFGDGSIFSYSAAAQDAWAFHFHNISGRVFVYLYSLLPAETYVALTKDAQGGIVLYGFLFFGAQLFGLIGTYAADRSKDRVIFSFACASNALLGPMVFGAPSEMLIAHALFWPALAVSHYPRESFAGHALVFALLLMLGLSHDGGLVFAIVIGATLSLRGRRDKVFRRIAVMLAAVILIWAAVKITFPADHYAAGVIFRAALRFFSPRVFTGSLFVLIVATIAAYGLIVLALQRLKLARAHIYAAVIIVVALGIYWLCFDQSLHTENRYFLRTIVLLATPVLGLLAAGYLLSAEGRLKLKVPLLPRAMKLCATRAMLRAATYAFLLVMLIHTVETAKFIVAWTDYKAGIRALAMGTASDPGLGDPRFVSAERLGEKLNRLSWNSTTLYLSVLLAPDFAPARLVIDPTGNYFWLTCRTAAKNLAADRAIPAASRELIRVFACQHHN